MSYFANINEDNIVEQVISAPSIEWCEENIGGIWLETSYNTSGGIHYSGGIPLRKNYAGIGYSYDQSLDAFIPLKPYPSWILNQDTCLWEPPIAKPTSTNKDYKWIEANLNWEEIN
jgi:hypothetical protein